MLFNIFSDVPYPLKMRRRTLSVSPYGSWIIWTWSRHSPINNHQRDLEIRNDSHSFNDELVIAWTINVVTNSFCLAIFYLSEIRSSVSTIPSSISLPTSTLYSFRDMTFLWPSHVLASDINVIHREGPEYISPSSGWTNPTLDPRASTNTFQVPNDTFIITLLRCDVWWNQSTLPV